MARKAIVDRNIVLQLLKEGKTSQSIANQFGVSRQAIDLYRKEFMRSGLLKGTSAPPETASAVTATAPPVMAATQPAGSPEPAPAITPEDISLDQMIELLIKAFSALKRMPELEAKLEKYRRDYERLFNQIEQLEERERKRNEQENRWIQVQHPDTLTNK